MAEEIEHVNEAEPVGQAVAQEKAHANLPFILTLAALLIYFGFQTVQLLGERSNMILVKSNQDAAIQEAQKVQAQFKNLVAKTSELADQGHFLLGLVAGVAHRLAHDVEVFLLHVAGIVAVVGAAPRVGDALGGAPGLQGLVEEGTVVVRVQPLQGGGSGALDALHRLFGPSLGLIQQNARFHPPGEQLHGVQAEGELTVGVAPVMAYQIDLVGAGLFHGQLAGDHDGDGTLQQAAGPGMGEALEPALGPLGFEQPVDAGGADPPHLTGRFGGPGQ